MKIGKLNLGLKHRPKIIAEIGINHNGSLDQAKKFAELAASSGADIVKTQFHIPDAEMSPKAREIIPGHCDQSIFSIMEECSLSTDEEYGLKEFIENLGCEYLSTPFSAAAAEILGQFNVNAFKIGSGECNNFHVLNTVSKFNKPLLISTGMNSLQSCRDTLNYIKEKSSSEYIFLHTTNLYPTPYHLVRLGGLSELQELVGIENVGLSDHTTSNLACLGAVALGAIVLERHFTDTKEREGPDIINSMDPGELKDLREKSQLMYQMRGGSKEFEIVEEQGTRDFAFATLVAKEPIHKNQLLTKLNCAPQRPAAGDIPASEYYNYLGKTAILDIKKGTHILKKWVK